MGLIQIRKHVKDIVGG